MNKHKLFFNTFMNDEKQFKPFLNDKFTEIQFTADLNFFSFFPIVKAEKYNYFREYFPLKSVNGFVFQYNFF